MIQQLPWSDCRATSPGNHDANEAMMASGYLIPGRRLTFCHVHSNRGVILIFLVRPA